MHTTHAVAIVSAAAFMLAAPVLGGKHGHLTHAQRRKTSLLRHMRETTANDDRKIVDSAVACALEAASKNSENAGLRLVAKASAQPELRL